MLRKFLAATASLNGGVRGLVRVNGLLLGLGLSGRLSSAGQEIFCCINYSAMEVKYKLVGRNGEESYPATGATMLYVTLYIAGPRVDMLDVG
jgi:hypothetical protein